MCIKYALFILTVESLMEYIKTLATENTELNYHLSAVCAMTGDKLGAADAMKGFRRRYCSSKAAKHPYLYTFIQCIFCNKN